MMTRDELIQLRNRTIERLHAGEKYIADRKASGLPYERAEGQWIELLHQYESVEDALLEMAKV